MLRFLRRRIPLVVGLFAALVAGALGPAAAGASARPHGSPRLIDTDRVVGFPQHASGPGVTLARSGSAPGRGVDVVPSITAEPVSDTVAANTTATFTAAASGTPTPTVQWALSTNGGRRWSSIGGATTTTYSFTASAAQNGEEFEAVFRNAAGSATTTAATLTVSAAPPVAPLITTEPVSDTVAANTTATFTAAASGTPTPTVQWAVSTNGGTTFASLGGATSSTYSFTASSALNGDEYEATFRNAAGSVTSDPASLTVTPALAQSSNWSGYADLDATFSAVSGNWTVPTVTCAGRASSYSAQWVGIDGYSSSTVEQDGTEADCLNGSPSYDAWYEMYGDAAVNSGDEVELSPSQYPISPGDPISASVTESAGSWTLRISDASTAHPWVYSTQIAFTQAAQSSAEWVVERPEICSQTCALTSLADFGSVTFTGAAVTTGSGSGTISSTTDSAMEMVNGSTLLAVPGSLDTAGDSFADTWQAA